MNNKRAAWNMQARLASLLPALHPAEGGAVMVTLWRPPSISCFTVTPYRPPLGDPRCKEGLYAFAIASARVSVRRRRLRRNQSLRSPPAAEWDAMR